MMAAKGEKLTFWTGSNDKRSITVTLCQSPTDTILPFQLTYKGKTVNRNQMLTFLTVFPCRTMKNTASYDTETVMVQHDPFTTATRSHHKWQLTGNLNRKLSVKFLVFNTERTEE